MITVVCGTNRPGSYSLFLSAYCQQILVDLGSPSVLIDLALLPPDFVFTALYNPIPPHHSFNNFSNLIVEGDKFLFVVPEYNGSMPGVLKSFIDGLPYPIALKNKKAAVLGLSAGMQGGALALSHLADILSYMGTHVLASRPKLAFFNKNCDKTGIQNELYASIIKEQMQMLIDF